jgi:hypothetical protein
MYKKNYLQAKQLKLETYASRMRSSRRQLTSRRQKLGTWYEKILVNANYNMKK